VIANLAGRQPAIDSRPRTKDKVDHRFDASRLLDACPGFVFTSMAEGLRRVASETAAASSGT